MVTRPTIAIAVGKDDATRVLVVKDTESEWLPVGDVAFA
jgi:hypothetical protein